MAHYDVKLHNAMFAYHRQTLPPTGVEFSVYCNFYNLAEKALVTAGTSVIKVYRMVCDGSENATDSKAKLEHMQTFNCFGSIVGMEKIRLNPGRDSLILVFKEAKVSLVEYDPITHDLQTLAIRSIEKEDYKEGIHNCVYIPMIKVDPLNRCAAVLIYGKHLAIIPFVKRDASELTDPIASLKSTQTNTSGLLEYYTIKLMDLEEEKGVDNIHDMTFLYGYYEPTLLLLYEPIKTWTGRVAIRQDTCAIMALSLNVYQRVHPPVWSFSNLPYNSFRVLPVPKPIGGVLIISVNAILYLNQSVPPYGASLNSFTECSTNFPLKEQDGTPLSLECCRIEFLSDTKILLSLVNGDLYVMSLFTDGMRSINQFELKRLARTPIATCVNLCEPGYLFVGSRLGNSLLLRYSKTDRVEVDEPEDEKKPIKNSDEENNDKDGEEKEGENVEENVKQEGEENIKAPGEGDDEASGSSDEPDSKRAKMGSDNIDEWVASDVNLITDPKEFRIFSQNCEEGNMGTTCYKLEVADKLETIGPIVNIAMGAPQFQSKLEHKVDPEVELFAACSHGRSGSLCVLQRTIKPQVITTFELAGCSDLWTVRSSTTRAAGIDPQSHQFLILSRPDSTMILQTGQEINELDHSGFCTQSPTIFAGNLADGRYIIQVCPNSVRLLEGVKQLQQVPIDVGSPLISASLADPHVLVMSQDGLVIHLTLRIDDNQGYKLSVIKPQFPGAKSKITAHCIYRDISGLFITKNEKHDDEIKPKTSTKTHAKTEAPKPVVTNFNFDDEDELLYGSSVDIKDLVAGGLNAANIVPTSEKNKEIAEEEDYEEHVRKIAPVEPTFWVFLARENGALEIYSIPDYKLRYFVRNFPLCNKLLQNAAILGQTTSGTPDAQLPKVMEIFMCASGMHSSRPILFARIESDLHIYEVYPFYEKEKDGHLKIQFKRLQHSVNMEPRCIYKQKEDDPTLTLRWIRPFCDVNGYSGVFVCGRRPHWVLLTARGELRAHPMLEDGRINSFATFHNVNCEKGFLYFNKYGKLRICTLPNFLSYDSPWPIRKIPINCSPHAVNFHVDSRTYCVATCEEEPATTMPRLASEDKEFEPIEREGRFIPPTVDKFFLELWSPVSWTVIPNTRIPMEDWEKITCVKNVMIASEGTTSGEQGLIAVGTIQNFGEDITAKGRILLLDVIEVVPEPGQPLTRSKIKTILSKPQNAPVTALCSVKGHLMAAVGQKLFLFQLKDNDLVGMAFLDTQVYILSAISIKSFILIGDVYKSITVLRYQEHSKTLAVVSRDTKPVQVYAIEYLIDNSQMAFLATDAQSNILVYMYQPENRETCGGQRLIRRGDFNVGSRINTMFRIRCRLAEIPRHERRTWSVMEARQVTVYATLDGSLGHLLPISEKTYRRLLMLQNVLNSYCQHVAGLNPKGFRMMQTDAKALSNPQKNVVDGDLIGDFMDLNFNEKAEVARKIGTTVHQILLDLAEIEGLTFHF